MARASITDLELGYSATNAGEWDTIAKLVSRFDLVAIDATTFDAALALQRGLAATGLKGRKIPDLLIAVAVHWAALTLVHCNRDFDHIATVTGQPTRSVVPASTVD